MTNKDNVIEMLKNMSNKELAEYLIFAEDIPDGVKYVCPDKTEFYIYDDAVNHVAEWLKGEAE